MCSDRENRLEYGWAGESPEVDSSGQGTAIQDDTMDTESTALLEPQTKLEITPAQYELVRSLVYDRAGINLGPNRQHLVQARLAKRIRVAKLSGFDEYFHRLEEDKSGQELGHLIDAISTNTTHFFRESDHFDFLTSVIHERAERERWNEKSHCLRIWSAASSSGEEPYSLGMTIDNALQRYPNMTAKLLATDISRSVLLRAKAGRYETDRAKTIPPEFRAKYIQKIKGTDLDEFEIVPKIRSMITYAQFNLMSPTYPFRYGFDFIFCRNVMIYFDQKTQEGVIRRMSEHLKSGGYFIVGHSESLNSIRHDLQYVRPTIYRKK